MSRKIPRNIVYDKETLYDNTLQLKGTVNRLIEENMFLKAKIKQLEDEITRKGKLLDGMTAQMGNATVMKQISNIKQKVFTAISVRLI